MKRPSKKTPLSDDMKCLFGNDYLLRSVKDPGVRNAIAKYAEEKYKEDAPSYLQQINTMVNKGEVSPTADTKLSDLFRTASVRVAYASEKTPVVPKEKKLGHLEKGRINRRDIPDGQGRF